MLRRSVIGFLLIINGQKNKIMFVVNFLEILKSFPPQLGTMIIAMVPIGELRVALPFALTVYKLPLWQAFLFSVLGNMVPIIFIIYFIGYVSELLMAKSPRFNKFFTWLFKRTKIKFEGSYARYGLMALAIFVAIPLPMTGAWTGALAAFLFQIPKKQAAFWIFLGVLGAGIIVSIITIGSIDAYHLINKL